MKLQDIFKLDLNTGGGNKLFARIMNKYNVPKKEYEKVKENIGNSSSDSSFTFDDNFIFKIFEDFKYYRLGIDRFGMTCYPVGKTRIVIEEYGLDVVIPAIFREYPSTIISHYFVREKPNDIYNHIFPQIYIEENEKMVLNDNITLVSYIGAYVDGNDENINMGSINFTIAYVKQ